MKVIAQFKIGEETLAKLQEAYYKKLGLENLLASNKNDTVLIVEYGKACAELSDLGSEIIAANYERPDQITEKNSWEIDFATATFTINE